MEVFFTAAGGAVCGGGACVLGGGLSGAQRAGFRRFLAGELSDPSNDELMENEMQAYLVNTPDPRFFRARDAGLGEVEAAGLRRAL